MHRDYVSIAAQYEAEVISGAIPACKWVRLACERNEWDSGRQGASAFPYRFDPVKAAKVCQAAERFPHIKGPKAVVVGRDEAGRPLWASIKLEPWQIWYLTNIFGWLHVETGLRRFRTAILLVPRKNAKSTIAAVVVLYMLTADGESGAECYSAATTRDQAKVVAEIAWEMARRSYGFCDYFGVKVGAKTTLALSVPGTASKFAPLSADAHTLDALNVSLAVIDELHAHKTRAVWDVLDTATGAREQPLILSTTTAGVDIGGICYEKVAYLQKVLQGVVTDDRFFGAYYTIDEGDDWRDPDVHRKANPNYGVSVNPDDLNAKVAAATQSPSAINNFLTKHLDVWVKAESAWLPPDAWAACGNPALKIEDFIGQRCWIIVDLAEVRDIAAVMVLFEKADGAGYAAFGRYYLPEQTIDASPVSQYSGWVHGGYLTQTDGNVADFQRIEDEIVELVELVLPQEVLFDRALASRMMQDLQARLGDSPPVIVVPQTVEVMNPALTRVEELVLGKRIEHDGNPVLAWMLSNVVVQRNHKGEVYPRKAGGKDSHNKIDGAITLFMGIHQAMSGVVEQASIYESRSLQTFGGA